MKTIPMLFSTPMVQAILDGRKTQTRRIAKSQPEGLKLKIDNVCRDWNYIFKAYPKNVDIDIWNFGKCPYGKIGNVLWVRETFAHTKQLNINPEDENYGFVYKADEQPWNDFEGWLWKPSIHMPKEACRLFLKIVSVRLEQLQNISEKDARNEGVAEIPSGDDLPSYLYKLYGEKNGYAMGAKYSFESLWNSINGRESWDANPWVWVVEFERTEKPHSF